MQTKQSIELSKIKAIAGEIWPDASADSVDLFTRSLELHYGTPLFSAVEIGTTAWSRFGGLGKATEFSVRVAREFPEYDPERSVIGDHRR